MRTTERRETSPESAAARKLSGRGARRAVEHDKPAAADVFLTNHLQPRNGLFVRRHDHVLKEIAQGCLNRPFVLRIHVEVIGNRPLLSDVAVRLRQHHPRGFRVSGARFLELGQRRQARREPCQLPLPGLEALRFPLELDAGGRELRFARGLRMQRCLGRIFRTAQAIGCRGAIPFEPLLLVLQLRRFDEKLPELLGYPLRRLFGMLNRVTERRRNAQGREHLRACGFHVAFEPLDAKAFIGVFPLNPLELVRRELLVLLRLGCGGAAFVQLNTSRLPARFQSGQLFPHLFGSHGERSDLLAGELDLLLPPVDVDFAAVHSFACSRRLRLGLDERNTDAAEIGLGFGNGRRCQNLALAAAGQASPHRLDPLGRFLIAAHEEQFLPVPQLVPEPFVPPRLGRLTFERAELFLQFENDVFEPRQVQLRGLELQLSRPPPRFVLRDPRGFFNQLAPVGGTRAEDHPDLALLDDRVGFGPQAGVHQQFVDVAEAADLAVDQIFALARAIQAARHFDRSRDGRSFVVFVGGSRQRDERATLPREHVARDAT